MAISIIVKKKSKAKHLCAFRLQLKRNIRIVERYLEAKPSSVCVTCCGIRYKKMGSCKKKSFQYIICYVTYMVKQHCCNIADCNKDKRKTCAHMTTKYANYEISNLANLY